jgi:endonuclease/exonuclease/phosphatase family metal-dependent hydrolase
VLLAAGSCAGRVPPPTSPTVSSSLSCRQVVPAQDPAPTWISLSGDATRASLSRWCETVGPVLFRSRPLHPRSQPIDRLAIVTWNVHVGGGDVDDLVRRLRLGEFTGGERIDQFVLLLQEAYRRDSTVPEHVPRGFPAPGRITGSPSRRAPEIGHIGHDDGLALLYAPSMRNGEQSGDAEDRGNAIVSTLALLEPLIVELPFERQRRVAAAAIVEGETRTGAPWRLRVMDVHLETALAIMHGGPFAARRRQAEAIVDALAASPASPPISATVVAGDFNTWLGVREPAIHLLRRAFPQTPPTAGAPTWVGPFGLHTTLDHVFIGGRVTSARVQRLPSRFGSDHYPLLAIVSF